MTHTDSNFKFKNNYCDTVPIFSANNDYESFQIFDGNGNHKAQVMKPFE